MDLIVSVPDHCLSFYLTFILSVGWVLGVLLRCFYIPT